MSIKISELPSASYIGSEDYIPIVQNGTTKKGTANMLNKGEYTQLEYLESTGTQYIDTGYKPTNNTKLEIKFDNTASNGLTYPSPFGATGNGEDNTSNLFSMGTVTSTNYARTQYFAYDTTNQQTTEGTRYGLFEVTLDKTGATLNGTHIDLPTPSNFQTVFNAYIFASNRNGVLGNNFAGKIYYCKLYENGTLIRDYIPVIKNTTGEAGLLDKVNGVFYGNSGTGTFLYAQYTENYSTTEQRVGTWIDGKPLYEITVQTTMADCTTDGTSVNKNINYSDMGIANVDFFVPQFAFMRRPNGVTIPLLFAQDATKIAKYSFNVNYMILSNANTSYNSLDTYIVFRYTKSTDTATRGVVEQTRGLTKGGIDEDNMITPVEQPVEEKKEEEPIEKKSEEVVKENNEVSGEELKKLGDEPVDEQTK